MSRICPLFSGSTGNSTYIGTSCGGILVDAGASCKGLCAALEAAGGSLSELRAPFERYADSGEINTRVDDPAAVIERVAEHFSDLPQDRLDGLTVDGGDWWFNLRPSNTEPLLRLNLEAPDAEACTRRTEEVRALLTA